MSEPQAPSCDECPSCHTVEPRPHTDYCELFDSASGLSYGELYAGEAEIEPMTAEELRAWLRSP